MMATRTFPKLAQLGLILLQFLGVASASAAELHTGTAGVRSQRRGSLGPVHTEVSDTIVHGGLLAGKGMPLEPDCAACGVAGCDLSCFQRPPRWARLEYLLWLRRGNSLPPLATTSPNGTPLNQAGVLGAAGTTVLLGNATYGEDATAGGRLTFGGWLDGCECNAWEGRFFALGTQTINFNVGSNGDPILARPIDNRDATLGATGPTSLPLAFPGIANNGAITVVGESEIYGGDVILRHRFCDTGCVQLDILGGYQLARINDSLSINSTFTDADPNNVVVDGTRQDITDRFSAENEFHGGLIGLGATFDRECWRLELLARIAFGSMRQRIEIAGQTTNTVPPNTQAVVDGGLLANAGNQGTRERNEFAVAPELGANVVFSLTECLDLSVGYSFMYWSSVVQTGAHIDPDLFVPSRFAFNDNPYWVHGVNAGIEFRF